MQEQRKSATPNYKSVQNFTRKKICKYYDVCNNCGKQGHSFKQCKNPITSFGVIIFRICPKTRQRQYLMIRRKDTLGFIDFMRGKYSVKNTQYILNMFKQMTYQEKMRLKTQTFDELWKELWSSNDSSKTNTNLPPYYESFRQEEINSREKFSYLSTTYINYEKKITLLENLINQSCIGDKWDEPEWGFPKGRRNHQERDYECALREMTEETGYPIEFVKNIKNILPFDEYFLGSNYKSYKHKYYLMYMDYETSLRERRCTKDIDTKKINNENNDDKRSPDDTEVSSVDWKSYEECLMCIRPYNLEKKRLITNIEIALNKYKASI